MRGGVFHAAGIGPASVVLVTGASSGIGRAVARTAVSGRAPPRARLPDRVGPRRGGRAVPRGRGSLNAGRGDRRRRRRRGRAPRQAGPGRARPHRRHRPLRGRGHLRPGRGHDRRGVRPGAGHQPVGHREPRPPRRARPARPGPGGAGDRRLAARTRRHPGDDAVRREQVGGAGAGPPAGGGEHRPPGAAHRPRDAGQRRHADLRQRDRVGRGEHPPATDDQPRAGGGGHRAGARRAHPRRAQQTDRVEQPSAHRRVPSRPVGLRPGDRAGVQARLALGGSNAGPDGEPTTGIRRRPRP